MGGRCATYRHTRCRKYVTARWDIIIIQLITQHGLSRPSYDRNEPGWNFHDKLGSTILYDSNFRPPPHRLTSTIRVDGVTLLLTFIIRAQRRSVMCMTKKYRRCSRSIKRENLQDFCFNLPFTLHEWLDSDEIFRETFSMRWIFNVN